MRRAFVCRAAMATPRLVPPDNDLVASCRSPPEGIRSISVSRAVPLADISRGGLFTNRCSRAWGHRLDASASSRGGIGRGFAALIAWRSPGPASSHRNCGDAVPATIAAASSGDR